MKWSKNRRNSSDFMDFWTKIIAATRPIFWKKNRTNEKTNKRTKTPNERKKNRIVQVVVIASGVSGSGEQVISLRSRWHFWPCGETTKLTFPWFLFVINFEKISSLQLLKNVSNGWMGMTPLQINMISIYLSKTTSTKRFLWTVHNGESGSLALLTRMARSTLYKFGSPTTVSWTVSPAWVWHAQWWKSTA